MASIDVSDLMSDPDFADVLSVERNTLAVSQFGRGITTIQTYPFMGVVQAPNADVLQQLPDEERVRGSIQVYTTFRLYSVTDSTSPDVVVWKGRHYVVQQIDDWTNWGAGHVSALCTLRELTEPEEPIAPAIIPPFIPSVPEFSAWFALSNSTPVVSDTYPIIPEALSALTITSLSFNTFGGSYAFDVVVDGATVPGLTGIAVPGPRYALPVPLAVPQGSGLFVFVTPASISGSPAGGYVAAHYKKS